MYFVKYGSEWLHDSRVEGVLLSTLEFEAEKNGCGFCTFQIDKNHPMYDKLEPRNNTNLITIYDNKLSMEDPYWCGYIYNIDTDFQLSAEVKCKGILSYLEDSMIKPYSTLEEESTNVAPESPYLYWRWLIGQHNSQMDNKKTFVEGLNQLNDLDGNDYIYRANSDYTNTWNEISDKLLDILGGYILVRYEDSKHYIDYVSDFDSVNTQVFDFGINLLDFTRTDDSLDVVTCIIPLGAKMSDTDYTYFDGYFLTKDSVPDQSKTYYEVDKYKSCETDMQTFTKGINYFELFTKKVYSKTSDRNPSTWKTYYTLGDYSESSKLLYFEYGIVYYERSGNSQENYCYRKTSDKTPNYYKKYYTRRYSAVNGLKAWESGIIYYDLTSETSWYSKTNDVAPIYGKRYYQLETSGSKSECYGDELTSFSNSKVYYEYDMARDETNFNLTISDLDDGKINEDLMKVGDHVYSVSAVEKFGFIYGTYKNEDITDRSNLRNKGLIALGGLLSPLTTIEVKAIDLSLINPDYKPIRVGEYVRVRSKPHNFDSYMLCTNVDLDLVNPENSKYTLGFTYDTFTGQANKKINALNAQVNHVYQTATAISQEAKDAAQAAATAQNTATSALEQVANLKGKFLYIRYSANEDGSYFTNVPTADTKYMGIYSGDNETAPENASDYVWSLIKGNDGVGVKGEDGKPAYLHIKYSNDGGETFTAESGEVAGDYIGTCTDNMQADPTSVTDYNWARIKGDNGNVTYIETPTHPYFVGDMWTVQASGDKLDEGTLPFALETRAAIYVCIKDSAGEFNMDDWSIAGTDDSAAQEAVAKVEQSKVVSVETYYSLDKETWTTSQPKE